MTDLNGTCNAVLFANGGGSMASFNPERTMDGLPEDRTVLVFFNAADAFHANPAAFAKWPHKMCVFRFDSQRYFGWPHDFCGQTVRPIFLIHGECNAADGFFTEPVSAKASFDAQRKLPISDTISVSAAMLPHTQCGATTGFLTAMALRKILPGQIVLVGFHGVQPWSVGSHDENAEHAVLKERGFAFRTYCNG